MHKVKVSVIVPVFNSANYLEQCLVSILTQSLREIEVLVINDGSSDGSREIILQISESDNRIIFIDGPNTGVSGARNRGLKMAVGEYIAFADADDWMEPDMLEKMFKAMKNTCAEMVVCNVNIHEINAPKKNRLILQNGIFEIATDRLHVLQEFMDFKYDYANWNKLYKRELIEKHQILFNSSLDIWEDLLFNLCFLNYINKLAVIDGCLYNYRVHASSVMAKQSDFIAQYNYLFIAYKDFCETHSNNSLFKVFNYKMANGCYNSLIPQIVKQVTSSNPSYTSFIHLLSKHLKRFNKEIYLFRKSDLTGLQGIKKRLLMNERFSLFAHIVALKHYRLREWI